MAHASARYRLVHFIPDPGTEGRVPIAALLEQDSVVSVVKAPTPCACSLGGRSGAALVAMVLQDLDHARRFVELPQSVGPQVVLGEPRDVPPSVDATAWVGKVFRPPADQGGPDPLEQLADHIEAHMREACSTRGIRVFVADAFTEHGTKAEILAAFRLLERRGLVEHPMQCMECEDWTAEDAEERNDHVRAVFKPEAIASPAGPPPAPPRENPFFGMLRQVGS